jgi:hypothetical protein
MAFLSGGHFLTGSHCKLRPNSNNVYKGCAGRGPGSVKGTVRVFRQDFALEDAIGSHACSLEASSRATNGIPLRRPLSYRFTL